MRRMAVLAVSLGLAVGGAIACRASVSWRPALPGHRYAFPRDHAAHPEFQTEWWYYTGHLRARDGRRFGFELTFFRVGVRREVRSRSAWALRDVHFAHFTLTDVGRRRFFVTDRVNRGALGMSGALSGRYRVWLDDWEASLEGKSHTLRASDPDGSLTLHLRSTRPPVIHGVDGVSRKAAGPGRASHYYSLTRMQGGGTVRVSGETLSVTAQAWMDHEWGSNQLTPEQVGWDWFSLQLDDGRELMLYLLRRRDGSVEPVSSGTLVEADGRTRHLPLAAFRTRATGEWRSPHTGGRYPSGWRVQVPAANLDVTVTPVLPDQEVVTTGGAGVVYWEGAVHVRGSATGVGYVELTGYAPGSAPGF